MRKTIIIYGLALAALTAALKFLEYKYVIRDLSLEFYLSIIAISFTAMGIWAGMKLSGKRKTPAAGESFVLDEVSMGRIGLSKREMEVLELIALGHSNQEVADKLFVSLNTVKTHLSNLFIKLEVKRRTQAIQRAKELRLIP